LRALVRSQVALEAGPFAVLLRESAPGVPQPRRSAAVDVLGVSRLDDSRFVRFIQAAAGDPMLSPASVVGAVPRGGLSPETARTLLGYLQTRVEAGWQLTEQQLAAVAAAVPAGRTGELEALLRGGDPERGRIVFGRKAGCANCHQVAGQGGSLGPDLTKIGAVRAGRDLIESIVMPSATFAQGYETYSATLRSGETVTGVRVRQPDDAVVLRDASGAETRLDASEGATVERQKLSLMPEGLLDGLSEAETSDLFAYLQSLR
jgi:putative heme-binding domain-containing protein